MSLHSYSDEKSLQEKEGKKKGQNLSPKKKLHSDESQPKSATCATSHTRKRSFPLHHRDMWALMSSLLMTELNPSTPVFRQT